MDTKVLESQILVAHGELQQLKSTLTPCIVFLNEILEIRKKRNIPDSTSHTLLSLLALDIKADIMKEVRPTYATVNQVEIIQDKLEESKQDSTTVKEMVLRFDDALKSAHSTIGRLEHESRDNKDRIEDVRFQLDGKATLSNMQELRQLIKNCATIPQMEIIRNRVGDCAGKYQLEELQKNLIFIESQIKKLSKSKTVKKMIEALKDELVMTTEKEFVSNDGFYKEREGIIARICNNENLINEVNNRVERSDSVFVKKFAVMKKQLESAPWMTNIKQIEGELFEKATYEDLKSFRLEISKQQKISTDLINNFQKSISSFEEVIARFDEILLIKAEKDDIYRIDQKLSMVVDKNEFRLTTEPLSSSIEKIQDAIKKLIKSSDIMDKHIESVSVKCNNLLKDNIDVSLVAKNLNDLRSVVDHKSNREDIYEIYDIMARKIEVGHLVEASNLAKKQLELCAVLLLSLCRTLVKNGENPLVVQKTREELLGSLNTLVNWIAGEQQNQKILLGAKKEESVFEGRRSLSRSFQRRNSMNCDQKGSVDFPRIKMT
jgi:hypothetical protein